MRKVKTDDIPEATVLQRIHAIVFKCKSAAFELAKYLQSSNYKCFVSWINIAKKGITNGKYIEQRRVLIMILEALLTVL